MTDCCTSPVVFNELHDNLQQYGLNEFAIVQKIVQHNNKFLLSISTSIRFHTMMMMTTVMTMKDLLLWQNLKISVTHVNYRPLSLSPHK